MSGARHTPGPWAVFWPNATDLPGVDAGDCSVVVWGDGARDDDDGGVRGRTGAEAEANALLIAAAPEMNAALNGAPLPAVGEGAEDFYRRYHAWYRGQRAAALAKAEGRG